MNQKSYLSVAVSRLENSAGPQRLLEPSGASANFTVRGVPASLSVTGIPTSFVLVTTSPVNSPAPPEVSVSAAQSYSTTLDKAGRAALSVRAAALYLTCWVPQEVSGDLIYVKGASVPLNAGAPVNPQSQLSAVCP